VDIVAEYHYLPPIPAADAVNIPGPPEP